MGDITLQDDKSEMSWSDSVSDVGSLLVSRTYLYTLFHKLFGGAATEELVGILTSDETVEFATIYSEDDAAMKEFIEFVVSLRGRDVEKLVSAADDEYTRLLVGPGRPEVLPWESPYLTNEASFFQENTVAVRRLFRRYGFVPKRCGHVPDDHISLLCAFTAESGRRLSKALLMQDLATLAEGLRAQRSFVVQHMANWLDSFALCAGRASSAVLLPQAAKALASFVRTDAIFLGEAAYWAESLKEESVGSPCGRSIADRLAQAQDALDRLAAVRLFGLEENELEEI